MKLIYTKTIKLILYLVILKGGGLCAQSPDIAQLRASLSNASSDTSIIDICTELTRSYAQVNLDSCLYFFEKGIRLAEKISDSKRIRKISGEGFYDLFDQAKYHEARTIADRELEIGKRLNDDLLISKSYLLMSNIYWELSDESEFYKIIKKAEYHAEKSKDLNTIAIVNNSLGNFYQERGEIEKGIEHRNKALKAYKETNDSTNIGILYYNMAFNYAVDEDYESSLLYSNLSISFLPDHNSVPYDFIVGRKAESLFFIGEEKVGFELLEEAFVLATRNQHKRSLIFLNKTKAKFFVAQKKYKAAIKAAERGVAISHEIGYEAILPTLTDILTECNKEISDFEKSLFWSEEKIKINKKLLEKKKTIEVLQLQAKYEMQKKETENQVLVLKNKFQKTLLFVLTSLGLLLLALGYFFLRRKQRKQFSEFRETVAADLHDDIGSNLNSISRMAKELKGQSDNQNLKKNIDSLVEKTNTSIKNIVDVVWSIDTKNSELGELIEKMEAHLDSVKAANPNMKIDFIKNELNKGKILTIKQKHNLLMVFKEAINNIQEHTNSSEIKIEVENFGGGFRLEVVNHFDSKKYTHDSTGRGLVNIRRRVMELDGQVEFQETTNKFEVIVELKKI